MNRKIKLSLAFIVTVVFGYFGFTIAVSSILVYAPLFGLCALAPFMISVGFWLDEYEMKKEKGMVKTATATETALA